MPLIGACRGHCASCISMERKHAPRVGELSKGSHHLPLDAHLPGLASRVHAIRQVVLDTPFAWPVPAVSQFSRMLLSKGAII